MSSIVIELQHDALNPNVTVPDLLRKALFIATKLDIPEFKGWVERELGGYSESDASAFPPYRVRYGTVKAQDGWSGNWIPVVFQNSDHHKAVSRVVFFDPAAEIESLMNRAVHGGGDPRMDFPPEQAELLRRNSQNGMVMHTRFIRVEDLRGILDSVRNEILRWSMKLEKDGILGNGMAFSAEEKRRASSVHYTTHFHAPVGNVAQNSNQVRQSAKIAIGSDDLEKFVAQFAAHLSDLGLAPRDEQRVEAQLAILKIELAGDPAPTTVSQSLHTLRNIAEGAIGSLLATGLTRPDMWQWIHHILTSV